MQDNVVSRRLEIIDFIHIDKDDTPGRLDGKTALRLTCHGVNQPAQPVRLRALAQTQFPFGPTQSREKSIGVERLENVVHGMDFESLQRVTIVAVTNTTTGIFSTPIS